VKHLRERFGERPFRLLDLCAGSGAIGLSVLQTFPHAQVSFGELVPEHSDLIRKNIETNALDASRADIRTGSLFEPFAHEQFDIIVSNPPYVPEDRVLEASVTEFEPAEALYAGPDGLSLITSIAERAAQYLLPEAELWIECDMDHAEQVRELLVEGGTENVLVRNDLYGRPRLCVGYYS
jgi:release factor glutamine methyltransferase